MRLQRSEETTLQANDRRRDRVADGWEGGGGWGLAQVADVFKEGGRAMVRFVEDVKTHEGGLVSEEEFAKLLKFNKTDMNTKNTKAMRRSW